MEVFQGKNYYLFFVRAMSEISPLAGLKVSLFLSIVVINKLLVYLIQFNIRYPTIKIVVNHTR